MRLRPPALERPGDAAARVRASGSAPGSMRRVHAKSAVSALVALVALVGAGCSSSSKATPPPATSQTTPNAIAWPAPPDSMARARAARLVPDTSERLTFHVHAPLDVVANSHKVSVPARLVIDI